MTRMDERAQTPATWATAPWTIKAYGALYVIGIVAYALFTDDLQGIGWSLLQVFVIWGMVRGARVAWIIALVFTCIAVLWTVGVALGQGPSDLDIRLKVIQGTNAIVSFALLVHPQTRAWCQRKLRLAES